MKKVGLYLGSFDPIHLGHINLAQELKEIYGLDEVVFCPSLCSPFKKNDPPIASAKDRLKMIELAIENFENFSITDIELKRDGLSYTIDTVKEFLKQKPSKLYILMGSDTFLTFPKWKDYDKINELAKPLVGNRELAAFGTKIRVMEITSTEIRKRLKKKVTVKHLLPLKVFEYIIKNKLYI